MGAHLMGQSTDAELWFGLCWDETDEPYYEDGVPTPVIEYLTANYPKETEDECDTESLAEKLIAQHGCCFVRHCYSDGATMYGLAKKESTLTASRGYPRNVTKESTITTGTIPEEWLEALRNAADAIGWPQQTPAWWMASYWG